MLKNVFKLKNRKARISGEDNFIKSSILIPIIKDNNIPSLLFQIRAENLLRQPNEICFPGGGIEKDEAPINTSIRETSEELCIPPENIHIIGASDTLFTPHNNLIYTFVGILNDYNGTFNEEVKEVFTVPLEFLFNAEPLCHYTSVTIEPEENFPFQMVQNGQDYKWGKGRNPVYFYTYKNKVIWGITARIIYDFINLIKT